MQDLSAKNPEESVKWENFCTAVLPEYDKKKKTLLVSNNLDVTMQHKYSCGPCFIKGGVPKPNRGNPVVSNTVAQYDSDPGVDWDVS